MDEGNKVKQMMKMEVRGNRAKGRPRMRWMDNIRHDINKSRLAEGDAGDRSNGGGWYIITTLHPGWTREKKNKGIFLPRWERVLGVVPGVAHRVFLPRWERVLGVVPGVAHRVFLPRWERVLGVVPGVAHRVFLPRWERVLGVGPGVAPRPEI